MITSGFGSDEQFSTLRQMLADAGYLEPAILKRTGAKRLDHIVTSAERGQSTPPLEDGLDAFKDFGPFEPFEVFPMQHSTTSACSFCKIVHGEVRVRIVFEDEISLAFLVGEQKFCLVAQSPIEY